MACPKCKASLVVPDLEEDATPLELKIDEPAPAPPQPAQQIEPPSNNHAEEDEDAPAEIEPKRKKSKRSLPPLTTHEPPLWLRHLHWLLVLALLPLAFSLVAKANDNESFISRLKATIEQASP